MPLLETDYCVEQINVPPKLPMILKQFCKSAIRTQPYDLLKWSSAYFNALANGEEPPTKHRLEYPPACSAYGLTLGYLKLLLRQLGADYNKCLPLDCVFAKWDNLCLDCRDAELITRIGRFKRKCQIKKFLSIGVGLLTRSITETMVLVCELFTHEPDGGSAMIPLGLFMEIYGYLAGMRCDGAEKGSHADLCLCSEPSERSFSDATTHSVSESQASLDHSLDQQQQQQQPSSQDVLAQRSGLASGIISQRIDLVDQFSFESRHEDFPSNTNYTLQSFGEDSDGSFRHEGEASYRSSESYKTLRSEVKKMEELVSSSTIKRDRESEIPESAAYERSSRSTGECSTDTLLSSDKCDPYYPDVHGIGGQIKAEEVARVAIWMSECGRRQSGMVGPRNIRHVNCPPLDGCYCPNSKTCSEFTDE